MPQRMPRKNAGVQTWARAIVIGLVLWLALHSLGVSPPWLGLFAALAVGATALANAELSVLLALIVLSVPIAASNPLIAIAFIVLAFSMERFLGSNGGRVFLLIALAVVGAWIGPVWAAPALAGLLMGPAEGALTAVIACVTVELWGVLTGQPIMGATITGGATAVLSFAHAPKTLLSSAWLTKAFGSINGASVGALYGSLSHAHHGAALILQPAVWALGAVVAGIAGRRATSSGRLWLSIGAASAGVGVVAAGTVALRVLLSLPIPVAALAWAAVASLGVAAGIAALLAWAFPLDTAAAATPPARPASLATEDADVDELLRLIATAEDKLANEHTSTRVVLITDMKSFSRMTEEDGSVLTAKAIQRHRDLLIPIVNEHGGCGKSTGGDGVVAAFESAGDAIIAAAKAQRALAEHNATHPDEREVHVRMGLAAGEVVLDNGGRPFIGAALNLAARVMNLADGGQVLATGDVAAAGASAGVPTHSFGEFELKNISKPVEIVEIVWDEAREPHDPRITSAEE